MTQKGMVIVDIFIIIIYINIKLMHIYFIYEAKHESININTISLCNY